MSDLPPKLHSLLGMFASMQRGERMEMLIDLSDKYKEPPPQVAVRPFPASHRVPGCESEAYVWTEAQPNGTLKYYFAVENPQGISARATAVILDKVLSGVPVEEVIRVPTEVIYQIFGQELSLGKNLGLTNMLIACQAAARIASR